MPNEVTQVELRRSFLEAMDELASGTYKGSGDVIDYSLYDRILLDFTTPRLEWIMFQAGLGQNTPAGVAKTAADTNIEGSMGIPVGSKLSVAAIKIVYTAEEERTALEVQLIQELLENSVLNFRLSGKDTYGNWKLIEVMGAPLNAMIIPAATNYNPPASVGRFVGILPLNLPIILCQQVTFSVRIRHYVVAAGFTGLDGDWITISLNGILQRLS